MTSWICSYTNPDTDGVASMIGLAELLHLRDGASFVPATHGTLNTETVLALELVGVDAPEPADPTAPVSTIAIVDTHNRQQLSPTLDPSLVTLVVDHHIDGDLADFPNADFRVQRVGSTATIILEMADERSIDLAPSTLGLLAAAIVSNTLNLEAPSTTDRDRVAVQRLRAEGIIDDDRIAQLTGARAGLIEGPTLEVVCRDAKVFLVDEHRIVVSQIEAPGAAGFADRSDLLDALDVLAQRNDADVGLLNLVCMSTGTTTVVGRESDVRQRLADEVGLDFVDGRASTDQILMRKTHLIPALQS